MINESLINAVLGFLLIVCVLFGVFALIYGCYKIVNYVLRKRRCFIAQQQCVTEQIWTLYNRVETLEAILNEKENKKNVKKKKRN